MTGAWTTDVSVAGQGASIDEAKFFHEQTKKWIPLSDDIRNMRFKFGEDAFGDPAIWITVVVPPGLEESQHRLNAIKEVIDKVKTDVWDSGVKRWPYIKIENQ